MEHSLGPACRLRPAPDADPDADKEDGVPAVTAQFFYTAIYPIDDPLSGSAPASAADAKPSKAPLRPFSHDDNDMLQQAWLGLSSESHRVQHADLRSGREPAPDTVKTDLEKRGLLIRKLASKHKRLHSEKKKQMRNSTTGVAEAAAIPETLLTACCSDLAADALTELDTAFCSLVRKTNRLFDVDEVVKDVTAVMNRSHQLRDVPSPRRHVPIRHPLLARERQAGIPSDGAAVQRKAPGFVDANDHGITGKPFVRVPSTEQASQITSLKQPQQQQQRSDEPPLESPQLNDVVTEAEGEIPVEQPIPVETTAPDLEDEDQDVVVGLARLHKVCLHTLQMKPVYWSPINDVAVVTRGTWFYKDTMMPVSAAVANQLETGYQELRPWTETWSDELRCAIDVGASGEEKVSYRLWPKEGEGLYRNTPVPTEPAISAHPFCASHCFQGEAATEGYMEPPKLDDEAHENHHHQRAYSSYSVIYKDRANAFLLKPSLQPSSYYNRRPILKIMKGVTVGIPVVRGFDRLSWERLHRRRKTQPTKSTAHGSAPDTCPACEAEKDRSKVTDLVLVAHGIGQKIAERVESYHFTHAVNGFRRLVDSEFQSPAVQEVLHNSQSRLMVLPLNWRIGLSFEDGGALQTGMGANNSGAAQPFTLKDIEPNTIPAIRSMISDVMFDIPFYMSHHKGKMIAALVAEANRVYRLWCKNNPGFAENGRVHLVAHSLGSVMAVEVLSRQPTIAPPLDLSRPEPETNFFEFDTRNLFLMGSPTGFFLLLERGALTPRRGRAKPGVDVSETMADNVGGEQGMFGCLAVDNIYNILAREDPIAYFLNGAVDPVYAASLKTAYVPTASTSFFKSFGDAMRTVAKGMGAANPGSSTTDDGRPPAVRLPSQLELEVHDFTREEIAEKKAFLLNDNGQIDWFLRSGGGPLEIQYLNMLSAHSSYWSNTDFIRMLCFEIGRRPGRANTLPAMRAVKATRRIPAAG
ncbi:hypothetical protein MKX07_005924 [Trichoderma sp. CBMAI-0711]|nr:hypothetical protein MKX07_005924 [Trichoderma sp. CBMAI-0711]